MINDDNNEPKASFGKFVGSSIALIVFFFVSLSAVCVLGLMFGNSFLPMVTFGGAILVGGIFYYAFKD